MVGWGCYLRPDQFLDHLTVIKIAHFEPYFASASVLNRELCLASPCLCDATPHLLDSVIINVSGGAEAKN